MFRQFDSCGVGGKHKWIFASISVLLNVQEFFVFSSFGSTLHHIGSACWSR